MPRERAHSGQSLQIHAVGKSTPNPVMCKEGRGERNFACQHYDVCLEKAAKGMWSGFTCKECGQFSTKEDET